MESINIKLEEYIKLEKLKKLPDYKNILQTIFRLGYNTYFNSISNNLEYYTVKDDLMNTLNDTIQPLNDLTKSLYGLNQSTKKGDITEALIDDIITKQFPEYNYDIKRGIAHHADGELTSPSGLKALVEVKNYNSTVPYDEVEKFKYDLSFRNITYGLFISIKSGIQFQKPFSYEKYEKDGIVYHIVYVSKVFEEQHKVYTSVLLLENIYKFIKKNDCSKLDKSILNNIQKIETIIDEFSKIKNKYIEMESNIKKSLDDYYSIIRDAEYQMKEKFNNIWNQIVDNENKLIKYSEKEKIILKANKKIQNILEKIFNKFDDNFKYVEKDDDIMIYLKDNLICTIKLFKLKIVIKFMNYDLTISGTNDDTKLLDAYINNKKINFP
uniref:Uncharacterized protein n=1 Tax=viral metagenome TaxID=1070528 RepID=A0A6C0H207_9ZZZZ